MAIQHITFSPSLCECVVELQYEDTIIPHVHEVCFFHNICVKHLPLVKNKKKLSDNEWKKRRDKVLKDRERILTDDRIAHIDKFENSVDRTQRRATIADLVKSKDTENHGLKMDAIMQDERRRRNQVLDEHFDNSMHKAITGIYSPYAFLGEEIYEQILKESREAQGITDNG